MPRPRLRLVDPVHDADDWYQRVRAPRRSRAGRAARVTVAATAVGIVAASLAFAANGSATPGKSPTGGKVMSAATRASTAPNVFYPLSRSVKARDLRTFSSSHHGTELVTPCTSTVYSMTAGTVRIIKSAYSGGTMITVESSPGKLTSYYAFMRTSAVTDGQIVTPGQPLGKVGDLGAAKGCMLHVEIRSAGTTGFLDPTAWLERYVGKTAPLIRYFGNTGFIMASFNALGATHTNAGGDAHGYPSYTTRTSRLISYVKSKQFKVIGFQEFQKPQWRLFQKYLGSTYATWPDTDKMDTENSIAWNKTEFTAVQRKTVDVPYFNGSIRKMPYVQLKQNSTGRTAWFINVHNPADTYKYHNQGKYRSRAVAIERQLMVDLRATGDAVYLTGDMNDRKGVYCAITGGKLAISANSVPNSTCVPGGDLWIDWIFGAGPTRFATYVRDWSTKNNKITDHPVVYSRAYLAPPT